MLKPFTHEGFVFKKRGATTPKNHVLEYNKKIQVSVTQIINGTFNGDISLINQHTTPLSVKLLY